MSSSNGYGSYSRGSAPNYSYFAPADAADSPTKNAILRRRMAAPATPYPNSPNDNNIASSSIISTIPSAPRSNEPSVVNRLDFMFPKVESEFTVQTDRGGMASLMAFAIIAILALAEIHTWVSQNRATMEHIAVDTSLGKRMRVNINITFPQLACVDLHVDAMDVAGDSQLDVEDTLIKKELHRDGSPKTAQEIKVDTNQHREQQELKERVLKEKLPEGYCGPCFGAQEEEGDCCQTCDELLMAYKRKRWKSDLLLYTAEQCIREGRDKVEPKRMTKGWGCNLSGYMTVNRVAGNFHIAMGEGIERDGRHIHTFVPDDSPNFNASHIIHQLSFGPGDEDSAPLNGVTKIVTKEHGTTGLFQYFIKIVPTSYKDITPPVSEEERSLPSLYEEVESRRDGVLDTNRYFYTERFRPLMKELLTEEDMEEDNPKKAGVQAGHGGGHSHHEHHNVQNSVLPGVFFVYEIYPFAVEVSRVQIPFTHLLIRLLATVGGVFTIVGWADAAFYARDKTRGRAHR